MVRERYEQRHQRHRSDFGAFNILIIPIVP